MRSRLSRHVQTRWSVLGVVAVLLAAGPASAQSQQPGTPSTPVAGWKDGFVLESDDGSYRLQFGVLLQADGRFVTSDTEGGYVNTFAFRRIRPILQGRVARMFDFSLVPDFSGGAVAVRSAYVETRFSPALRVRVGKDKTPFGLERLQSASALLFVERALPTAVAPDRDIGVQVLGDLAGGTISYAGGVFNGVADGASADADTNDGKDVVGRLVVRPFATKSKHPAAGLGVAIAGSGGRQPAALPSFRTSSQQLLFSYASNAAGVGNRYRVSPQVFYYFKRFAGFGEYIRSTGNVQRLGVRDSIAHTAWQVAGSFVLTGEAATDRGVRPDHPFEPEKHTWGALQLAARYHVLTLDRTAFLLGFAAPGASTQAKSFAVGANWYLNRLIKWVVDYERTEFEGDPSAPRRTEQAILFRQQIAF